MADSPAEELRAAARLIRERAGKATPGPWQSWVEGRDGCGGDSVILPDGGDHDLYVKVHPGRPDWFGYNQQWEADQDYIASMHPLVGMAVADLLDKIAWMVEMHPDQRARVGCDEAIAIARVYLNGETSGN